MDGLLRQDFYLTLLGTPWGIGLVGYGVNGFDWWTTHEIYREYTPYKSFIGILLGLGGVLNLVTLLKRSVAG